MCAFPWPPPWQVDWLGGCWTVWLLLWWCWCGAAALLCSRAAPPGAWWAQPAAVLALTLLLPLLAGTAPFSPALVPAHLLMLRALSLA